MSRKQWLGWMVLTAVLWTGAPAWSAQDDAPQGDPGAAEAPAAVEEGRDAAAGEAEGQALEGVIRAVRGPLTQIRLSPDEPWQKAEAGMRVPVGAELRTGARSQIQFVIPPDQVITVDRMTEITLLQALQQGPQRVKTDVGMVRGRANYQVADPQVEHDASVRSPNATNAVRGTDEFGISDDPLYGPFVYSFNTRTTVTNSRGQQVPMGGEGESSQMSGDSSSEGEQYFNDGILDPFNSRSRTGEEHLLVGRLPGLGGLDTGRQTGTFRGTETSKQFQDRFTPPPDIHAALLAMLIWETTADLDLFVIDSDGYKISTFTGVGADFVNSAPNGGTAGPDIAGPGMEHITYAGPNVPVGNFQVGVAYFSGGETPFTIVVLRNGVPVGVPFQGTVSSNNPTETTTYNIDDVFNNAHINTAGGKQKKRRK